ncbi:DUF4097 family beta strand repeat-containing protein [Terrabacter sp. Root181]|uniref:DUF4097 family beta strand repeat-containing protein n=1 Tax=Terrabacter sp. Root181 TaxID=1736484 RepID=UPI0006F29DDD|nr:DUF4097 family beta strand repeat-containing protein [Terrabacter sp. Root181]KRB47139.1 hypothetical protein ASD90_01790 [Terrabacter sp. Root181]
MSMHDPTPTSVPDDRVHGDAVPGAAPYSDSWLRPTLTTEPVEGAAAGPSGAGDHPTPPAPSARAGWLVAGLGATLVLASVAGVTTWGAATGGLWRSADEQQTYHQDVSELTFAGGSSDVEVRGGAPTGTVHVERHLSWGPGASQPAPKETWAGGNLTIDAGCDGAFLSSCSIDYVVTVPDATTVTVRNGSGDISVSGALGGVSLDAGSGDVEGSDLAASTLTAKTGSGDIDLALATAASPVSVIAGSGDVAVRLPQHTVYAVNTETGSGDTEVSVPTNPDSTSTLRIRTGSGDIAVDYR